MKKEMFKKLKAVILSVFMLGVVLFQFADAVSVMAADKSYSDKFLNSFKQASGDCFLECTDSDNRYFQYFLPTTYNVPIYFYLASFKDSGYDSFKIYVLHPASVTNFKFYVYNVTSGHESVSYLSGFVNTKVVFKGQNYLLSCFYPADLENSTYKLVGSYHKFSSESDLENFVYGLSDNSGEVINPDGPSGGSSDNKESFEKNNTYTRDLGYLKNVKYKLLSIKGADDSGKVKFSYSDISSSGFNVKQEGVSIRLYSQLACYNRKGDDLLSNMPVNYVGTYEASPLTFSVLRNDIYAVNDDLWNQVNTPEFHAKAILKGYNRSDRLFLQIVQKNSDGTFNYGGYTVLTCTYNSTGDAVVSVSTRTPDGGRDMDYSYTDKFSPTEGTGSSYEDAEENADNTKTNNPFDALFQGFDSFMSGFDGIVQVFQSFKSALFEIISYFGDFPTLIAKTFPFLPTFITTSISVGFLLAVVLRFLGR